MRVRMEKRWPIAATLFALFIYFPAAEAGDPAGVYALLPAYNSLQRIPLSDRPVWENPLVRGVTVRTVWKNMEPTDGELNWGFFDDAVALAEKHGKKVGLSMAAGIFTPDWVYRDGALPFSFTLKGPWRPTQPETMPVPWDPAFRKEWGAVIAAMGARYDGSPAVAYVMVAGIGFSIESFFVKTPEDNAKLEAMGGPKLWLSGAKAILDLYASAFPHKPFIVAMNPPVKNGIGWLQALVEYGMRKYPGRFGVMYHGLTGTADPTMYQYAAVRDYSAQAPTGFQMIWSTEGQEGQTRLRGGIAQALYNAVAYKAHFVEVYEVDCNNPEFHDVLLKANEKLDMNTPPVSGHPHP